MTEEQIMAQLAASALGVAIRAARLSVGRVVDSLEPEAAGLLLAQLEAGAHLEVRIRMATPPAARIMLVNGQEEREIGAIVSTLPKERLQ